MNCIYNEGTSEFGEYTAFYVYFHTNYYLVSKEVGDHHEDETEYATRLEVNQRLAREGVSTLDEYDDYVASVRVGCAL